LAEAGEDVVLVDIWREHVDAINSKGLRMRGLSGERIVRVTATSDPRAENAMDLILIFVKSYDTARATRDALPMASEGAVFLTLQNGLGNVEKIGEVAGRSRVLGGTTSHGSTLIGPGEIYHAGTGPTVIGELDGAITPRLRRIVEVLDGAGIETEVSSDIEGAIWSKVLVNVGINTLTALTGMRNGELLRMPEIRTAMRRAVEEALEVAAAKGIGIEMDDPVARVYEVARATADNISSMLQDVQRGRRTEIDALNGAVVELGHRLGIDTPVNEALTAAVKGLESVRTRTDRDGSA